MTYEDFCRKLKYISSIKIDTDDTNLKKSLEKVIKKEINKLCRKYYK